uniref:Uncharacterized protein AlNc14C92G5734 n=1 Tax=Albugo laibachii Nc14 TaxID=890382 RepID=F0WGK6_9STRA|nr:cleavage induced hypothetical protein [Albugo laibachii Nc14]|eukprot:CCA20370.1 cleavage induced hypothetical protein [Albugo laibachii Nc14]
MDTCAELALETQLLLQEIQCQKSHQSTEKTDALIVVENESNELEASEYDKAMRNLVGKLKKRKEELEQSQRKNLESFYSTPHLDGHITSQAKKHGTFRLPVAAPSGPAASKKRSLVRNLRHQAIKQGSAGMAKLFGYSSFEEQLRKLQKEETMKLQLKEQAEPIEYDADSDESDTKIDSESFEIQTEEPPEIADSDERNTLESPVVEEDVDNEDPIEPQATTQHIEKDVNRDKASIYRQLVRKESVIARKRKRLVKGAFVESEAEEEEEENVLQIVGLGDFGFGVARTMTQGEKEAEEERKALELQDDDFKGIVDELSDDELAEQRDLDTLFRKEQEEIDRKRVRAVMRNVKEGFGRNRRVFSTSGLPESARGRFHLDELVAVDGDKNEAARLGLLESDEEVLDGEDVSENNEDEEMEMERKLRERHLNQPKIYITSESESDSEEDQKILEKDDSASDDEREKKEMKVFSERAKMNRRIRRWRNLQQQEDRTETAKTKVGGTAFGSPDNDAEARELMQALRRTDVSRSLEEKHAVVDDIKSSKLARDRMFRSSSSFRHVLQKSTKFSTNATGKPFVFTCTHADVPNEAPSHDPILRSKASKTPQRQTVKRQKSEFLAILQAKR